MVSLAVLAPSLSNFHATESFAEHSQGGPMFCELCFQSQQNDSGSSGAQLSSATQWQTVSAPEVNNLVIDSSTLTRISIDCQSSPQNNQLALSPVPEA